jgi:hypothetical protein
MPDRYIDNAETQIYGPYAIERLRTIEDVDPVVSRLITSLGTATTTVHDAMAAATSRDGDLALAVDGRGPVGAEAMRWTNAFHDQLKAWIRSGQVRASMMEFFPEGTKRSAGETPAQRREGLRRILGAIEKYDVPAKEDWTTRFRDLHGRLTEVVETSDTARKSRKPATVQLGQARDGWLRQYRATKLIVQGLLVMAGREAELRSFFRDLQVGRPTTATTTETTPPPA